MAASWEHIIHPPPGYNSARANWYQMVDSISVPDSHTVVFKLKFATLTFLPFTLSGSVTILASLDFLGFGLPPGSPSLGELVAQGKNNLQAPWLGFTAFFVLGGVLTLLIFVGEAVRDAFDPRRLPV